MSLPIIAAIFVLLTIAAIGVVGYLVDQTGSADDTRG